MPHEGDDFAPVAAPDLGFARQFPNHGEHLPQRMRTAEKRRFIAAHRQRLEIALAQRQKAAARNRVHKRRAACIARQCQHGVGHGQAIAHDQHRLIRGWIGQVPGIMAIRRMFANARSPRVRRRRRVSHGQNHAIRREGVAPGEVHGERAARAVSPHLSNFVEDAHQPHVRRRMSLGVDQDVVQIVAVQRPGQEILAVGIRHLPPRKLQELRGIGGVRRQARRGHIEQEGKFPRRVRHTAAHRGAAFDENDVSVARGRPPEQGSREHRAGKAGADDNQGVAHR